MTDGEAQEPRATLLPLVSPNVIYRALDDGGILLSTTDEVYYGLNLVGVRVWELLPPALSTVDELCLALESTYPDVDRDTIRADVAAMLADLTALGLVVPRDAAGAEAARPSPGLSARA